MSIIIITSGSLVTSRSLVTRLHDLASSHQERSAHNSLLGPRELVVKGTLAAKCSKKAGMNFSALEHFSSGPLLELICTDGCLTPPIRRRIAELWPSSKFSALVFLDFFARSHCSPQLRSPSLALKCRVSGRNIPQNTRVTAYGID